jgi:tetratricopeptide (TPR) repeat protein
MALATPLFAVNPLAAAELQNTLEQARMLCERLGETELLARVLLNLFFLYWSLGDLPKQRELAQMGLELAATAPAEIVVFCANWVAGFLAAWTGQYDPARTHLERALAVSLQTQSSLLSDPRNAISVVDCIEYLGFVLWMLGYPEQALLQEQRLVSLTNTPIDPYAWGVGIDWHPDNALRISA